MIIGLTGSLAAGKGVVSDFLKKQGFVYLSLSNELREIAKEKKIELTREKLQNLGNQLREENGSSTLAETIIKKIINQQYQKCIVDGIRNPAEIDALKKMKNFFLISMDASPEIRFNRMKERARESDPQTWEDFLRIDSKDKGLGETETGQGVGKCMMQADFTLINAGTLEEIEKKVQELYVKIESKIPRPSWDEYFMEIAKAVSKRATCNRGKSGCVIAKNKQILVTGYVGSPKGFPHCDEVGHQIETTIHEDGIKREHCIRTAHSEQNAICQAAKFGIPINGATLYCKMTPCPVCAKMIINVGIKRVVCEKKYQSGAENLLMMAGIQVDILNNEIERY